MSKRIPTTIGENYVSHWSFFEGVREFLQNGQDAAEYEGFPMTVEHFPRTDRLVITTQGAVIDPKLLIVLGESSKRESDQRGKFGEGFNLAALSLIRAGHAVSITNGDEVFRPVIDEHPPGHSLAGVKLLMFDTRSLQKARTDFIVEIENISKDVWEATKKLFLFLAPPKATETVEVSSGKVLLSPDYRGQIFCRGIYVNTIMELECGYDLRNLKLDRDRKVVDEWDLKWSLGDIWNEAHKNAPDKFAAKIYAMTKNNSVETRNLSYRADEKLLKALRDEFEDEHGVDVMPVTDSVESRELTALGAATAIVNKTLKELLDKAGLKTNETKKKLEESVKTQHPWAALTSDEQRTCLNWVEKITREYIIVDFNDSSVSARLEEKESKILIARWMLIDTPRILVQRLALFEARRLNVEPTEVLLNVIFGNDAIPLPVAQPAVIVEVPEGPQTNGAAVHSD